MSEPHTEAQRLHRAVLHDMTKLAPLCAEVVALRARVAQLEEDLESALLETDTLIEAHEEMTREAMAQAREP